MALPAELVRVEEPGVVLWLRGSRFHREDDVVLCGASAIVFCFDKSQRNCFCFDVRSCGAVDTDRESRSPRDDGAMDTDRARRQWPRQAHVLRGRQCRRARRLFGFAAETRRSTACSRSILQQEGAKKKTLVLPFTYMWGPWQLPS